MSVNELGGRTAAMFFEKVPTLFKDTDFTPLQPLLLPGLLLLHAGPRPPALCTHHAAVKDQGSASVVGQGVCQKAEDMVTA